MSSLSTASNTNQGDYWIFGYGSLIWKPPPHYDLRIPGYIKGYVRRFWQASEDHRGYPGNPGRVVTLIEYSHWADLIAERKKAVQKHQQNPAASRSEDMDEEDRAGQPDVVYGAAYRIPKPYVKEVQEYLDIREINGYSIQYTPFYDLQTSTEPMISKCMVYIGLPTNPQFVGAEPLNDVAAVIARSAGPSGPNPEYLFMLQEGLKGLGLDLEEDRHVNALAQRVRVLLEDQEAGEQGPLTNDGRGEKGIKGLDSDAAEETEKMDP